MGLACDLEALYSAINNTFGALYNIYRPNFNVVDQTPALLGSFPLTVTPGGSKYAIPNLAGVMYFTITGNRSNFLPGDIIIPVNSNSEIPPITILNYDQNLPCIGFRTSRIMNIVYTLNAGDVVYTNVYCDFASQTTERSGLIEDLSGALDISNTKIVLWSRTNIQPQNNILGSEIAGMKVVSADGINKIRFTVQDTTVVGNLQLFQVDQEVT